MTAPAVETTVLTTAANGEVSTITSTIPGAITVSTSTADAVSSSGDEKKPAQTGTIVGIAVGVVGGLALLGLAAWWGVRHGRRTAAAAAAAAAASASAGGYVAPPPQPVYPATSYTNVKDGVVEKDGNVYAQSDVRELSGGEVRRF